MPLIKNNCIGKKIAAILLLLIFARNMAYAKDIGYGDDILDIAVGARAMGIGRAAVAAKNDSNAIFINSSDLALNKMPGFTSMQATLLGGDIRYSVIGMTFPFFKDTVAGLGYVTANSDSIISPSQEGFLYSNYINEAFVASIAKMINPALMVGGSLKFYNTGYSGNINFMGAGKEIDVGFKYRYNPYLDIAVNFANILPADFGGKIIYPNGTEQMLPAIAKTGIRIKRDALNFYAGYDVNLERNYYPNLAHFGAEYTLNPVVALRCGFDQNVSAVTGSIISNPTFGVGFDLSGFKFDYAYHFYHNEASNVTHYLSVGYILPEPAQKPVVFNQEQKIPAAQIVISEEARPAVKAVVKVKKPAVSKTKKYPPKKHKPSIIKAPKGGKPQQKKIQRFYDKKSSIKQNKIQGNNNIPLILAMLFSGALIGGGSLRYYMSLRAARREEKIEGSKRA